MFRLMRNVHLILGLLFFLIAGVFAVSSLKIIYGPWLPESEQIEERTVQIAAEKAGTPRSLALELMQHHGLKGDLRQIEQDDAEIRFTVARAGTRSQVTYSRPDGEAKITTRSHGLLETLVQLHTTHGFHYEFLPSSAWSLLSVLGSVGLFLLGASGIYLWYCHHEERILGSVLLSLGLIWGLTTLFLSRTA